MTCTHVGAGRQATNHGGTQPHTCWHLGGGDTWVVPEMVVVVCAGSSPVPAPCVVHPMCTCPRWGGGEKSEHSLRCSEFWWGKPRLYIRLKIAHNRQRLHTIAVPPLWHYKLTYGLLDLQHPRKYGPAAWAGLGTCMCTHPHVCVYVCAAIKGVWCAAYILDATVSCPVCCTSAGSRGWVVLCNWR